MKRWDKRHQAHQPIFISCSSLTHRQEKQNIKAMINQNARRAHEVMCSLPGFCSQPVQGGAFIFPRVDLPSKAIQKAKVTISNNQVITAVRALIIKKRFIAHDFSSFVSGNGNETGYILLFETSRGGRCVHQSWLRFWTKWGNLPYQVCYMDDMNQAPLVELASKSNSEHW